MIELAQLFQDVDAAIVQQEPAIVDIEQKAEGTHENIGQANTQLDGAIKKARSRNRKKWICLFLFCKPQPGVLCCKTHLLMLIASAPHHHHCRRRHYCGEGGYPRPKTSMICNFNTDRFRRLGHHSSSPSSSTALAINLSVWSLAASEWRSEETFPSLKASKVKISGLGGDCHCSLDRYLFLYVLFYDGYWQKWTDFLMRDL